MHEFLAVMASLAFLLITAASPATITEAQQLIDNGENKAAIKLLEKHANSENGLEYFLVLARAYRDRVEEVNVLKKPGLTRKLHASLEKALEIDPHNVEALRELSDYYYYVPGFLGGDKQTSADYADRLMAVDPFEAHMTLGSHARDDGDAAAAAPHFANAVASNPESAAAHIQYGRALVKLERVDEAIAQFDAVLTTDPNNLDALFHFGRAAAIGDKMHDRAIEALTEYIANVGPKPTYDPKYAYYFLGVIYKLQENLADAKNAFETALKLDPNFDEAKTMLERISQ